MSASTEAVVAFLCSCQVNVSTMYANICNEEWIKKCFSCNSLINSQINWMLLWNDFNANVSWYLHELFEWRGQFICFCCTLKTYKHRGRLLIWQHWHNRSKNRSRSADWPVWCGRWSRTSRCRLDLLILCVHKGFASSVCPVCVGLFNQRVPDQRLHCSRTNP